MKLYRLFHISCLQFDSHFSSALRSRRRPLPCIRMKSKHWKKHSVTLIKLHQPPLARPPSLSHLHMLKKSYRSLIDGPHLSASRVCSRALFLLTVHNDKFIVIDLSRLLLGYCPEAFSADGLRDQFADALFKAADWSASWALPLPKPRETNMLLLLRTLCNAFQEDGQTDPVWLTKVCFWSVSDNQSEVVECPHFPFKPKKGPGNTCTSSLHRIEQDPASGSGNHCV